jgi:hypothetical protein
MARAALPAAAQTATARPGSPQIDFRADYCDHLGGGFHVQAGSIA